MKSEKELWLEYKKTKSPQLKEKLIMLYAPLVKYIAGKIAISKIPGVEYEDLVSFGIIGLLDAIERFNPDLGYKFKTYATRRIKGAIIDELRNIDCLPRNVRKKMKQLEKIYEKLEKEGKPANDEVVAKELGITSAELQKLFSEISIAGVISLNELGQEDEESVQPQLIEDKTIPSPETVLEREEIKKILAEGIKKLPKREKEVIILYYYEDLTQREIGKVLGITESRVSQLHGKAVAKLRCYLKKFKQEL
jgi:RNA polymerase sigma factor for flagellar operon FliA